MFNSKQTKLFEAASGKGNSFTAVATRKALKAKTTTALGNGSLKLVSSGNDFVDQFGKVTNYKKPRTYQEVAEDCRTLHSQNPLYAICFIVYIRLITRIVQFFDGSKTASTQRGQGLKHEGILRLIWLQVNHPESFWKNLPVFISIGSWKDIIQMLSYDLQFHTWKDRVLDWDKLGQVILAGLENPNTVNLVKKYLPQIKANSACKTLEAQADNVIAKWICSLLFGTKGSSYESFNYRLYRKLKSSGTAHQWQQVISRKKLKDLNFDTIHGRALAQLVSGKFLKNNGLEAAYSKWIESKPVAKYTGYIYELLAPVKNGYKNADLTPYQKATINKQFNGVIEIAKKGLNDLSSFLVVVDSSSSMTSAVPGTKVSSYSVAKSMALYFSYLLKGPFEGHFMEFADKAGLIAWKGSTPVDRLQNDRCEAYGSTNFLGVAKVFCDLKAKGVPESDFPTGILCLSDGCFNSTSANKTNTQQFKLVLARAGFSNEFVNNFKIVLWDIPNGYYGSKSQTAFEALSDTPNLYHISGLDPAAVAFLMGTDYNKAVPKNGEELFLASINQEVMELIRV